MGPPFLNDLKALKTQKVKTLAKWIWNKLKGQLNILMQLKGKETVPFGCIYRGKMAKAEGKNFEFEMKGQINPIF
ncbi:MAG: hypothetical protein Ct9H90mP20_0110 [Candidatus Neomarinimicrobiota bacterium]|nr:MAG: hypothetical protein Ct9H90mP20_0110 [Candidatus Neomarinimicrobiota bacterium]